MKIYQQKQLPSHSAASSSHLTTMESLALPQELYWDGKSEPNSPPGSELFAIATDLTENENWLYNENFANEILLLSDENLELKPGAEILCDLIDTDELVVELSELKDETWPPQAAGITTHIAHYSELDGLVSSHEENLYTKQYPVAAYDESLFNADTLTSLTPPQSPPRNVTLQTLHEQQQQQTQHDNVPIQFHTLHYQPNVVEVSTPVQIPTPSTSNAYIASENITTELQTNVNNATCFTAATAIDVKNEYEQAQIVDKIVEELAKDIPDMSDEHDSQYTSYSPMSSNEESTIDEEWSPPSSAGSSPARFNSSASSSSSSIFSGDEEKTTGLTPIKKRRPYGRGIEDRKIRKKEQNKNAATRYRQKKKFEMEIVLGEEQLLTQRNEELKGKLDKCVGEMKYLKGLIREFYRKNKSG